MATRETTSTYGRTLALAAVAAVAVVWLFGLCPVSAQGTSANRTFDMPTVAPGGRVVVTLTVTGYGDFGALIETLPPGFSYVSSSTHPRAVSSGQEVSFVLLGDSSVTYTVTAPASEGSYRFDGTLRDENRNDYTVGGASTLAVGAPTPGPTLEPTPSATAEPTPTPAPVTSPVPVPTASPTSAPTATPAPTPTPTAAPAPAPAPAPTATPTPLPTAAPAPTATPTPLPTAALASTPTIAPMATPTAAPTPTSIPIVPVVDDGGMPGWVIAAIIIGVLLMIVAGIGLFISSRQQSV